MFPIAHGVTFKTTMNNGNLSALCLQAGQAADSGILKQAQKDWSLEDKMAAAET